MHVARIIRKASGDVVDDLFTTAVANLLWMLLLIPVVTAPPATLALCYLANRKARGEVTDVGDFFSGLRRYFWPAWRWALLNLGVIFFLAGDFVLTGRLSQSDSARFIQGFYIVALLIWLWLQLYILPFLVIQETPSVRQAVGNGALLLGKNIRFSLALALAVTVVMVLSTAFFLVIAAAGGILLALIANHAVLAQLASEPETAVAPT